MEQSTYDLIKDFIATVGFPIAVASYLLFRMERVIKAMTQAITDLKDALYRTRLDNPPG